MSDKKWTDNKNMADNIDMKNRKNGEEMKDPQDRLKVQEMEDERIEKQGQVLLNKNREKHRIHLLSIIGEIEGHEVSSPQTKTTKYEHVLPQLAAIEDSDEIDGILVLLNTVGGDVEAGSGHCGNDCFPDEADGIFGPWRKSFHRSAPGRFHRLFLYCKNRDHADPSCAYERHDHRRPSDL